METYFVSRASLDKDSSRPRLRQPRMRSNVFTSRTNCVLGSCAQSMVIGGPSIQDGLSRIGIAKKSAKTNPTLLNA